MPDISSDSSILNNQLGKIKPVKDNKVLIVALDYADAEDALNMADKLDPESCRVKVGKELFTRSGPSIVKDLTNRGFDVFLDLKFHDIPNTVAKAVLAAAEAGAWMVNVHASGGRHMMEAARNALSDLSEADRPLLIAVTVLTSMSEAELNELGVSQPLNEQVQNLASIAEQSGMDGVVSSAREAAAIKELCGDSFTTVTPGIRPAGACIGDQKRVMTPSEAILGGSDFLVVGRPITAAENPMQVVESIQLDIESAKS